ANPSHSLPSLPNKKSVSKDSERWKPYENGMRPMRSLRTRQRQAQRRPCISRKRGVVQRHHPLWVLAPDLRAWDIEFSLELESRASGSRESAEPQSLGDRSRGGRG